MPSNRLVLALKVGLLRLLGTIFALLQRYTTRGYPRPSFTKVIPSTLSPREGNIKMVFYTPTGYGGAAKKFPAVLNFHGGGFVVGTPTDDHRWAQVVLSRCNAIFVSVDYRMAPKYPFPTAVEDGTDAMLYLTQHAEELGIDVSRIATSGFSAGGNLAITVPLRWQEEKHRLSKQGLANVDFAAIVAWYPAVDYSISRDARRATCVRPEKTLPKTMTDMFDDSYIYPANINLANPCLSPAVAPDKILAALPDDVILYTCEFDMLQAEGERLKDRLQDSLGKRVRFRMVQGVVHAWDKVPFRTDYAEIDKLYREACTDLNVALGN